MNKIFWLASYPKSGNTWCRTFLSNLMSNQERPVSINDLSVNSCYARTIIDEAAGINTMHLTCSELDNLLPEIYSHCAEISEENVFLKTHDYYRFTASSKAIYPSSISLGVIYIIRNPLDVAISLAHHKVKSITESIKAINDECYGDYLKNQTSLGIPQHISSWSTHVDSWTTHCPINVLTIRYEDMVDDPVFTFEKVAKFTNLYRTEEKLLSAIRNSSFIELQSQENRGGFKEKNPKSKCFFRNGKKGEWKKELSGDQIKQIIEKHGDIMKKFGYLDHKNEVI